jgi:peptidyl-dipeptidase A
MPPVVICRFHLEDPPMFCPRFLILAAMVAVCFLLSLSFSVAAPDPAVTQKAIKFIRDYENNIGRKDTAVNLAWWDANTTGDPEAYKRKEYLENSRNHELSDRKTFAALKAIWERRAGIEADVTRRAVEVMYLTYLEKQVDPALLSKIVAKETAVSKAFNDYSPTVDGKQISDNEVRKILKESKDSARLKEAWEASKDVGKLLEADLKELVKLRNEAATQLGFKNYHALQLYLNEQDGDRLISLFDELDDLTRGPFAEAKKEIDARLAANYKIPEPELRPWHYHNPFFQETPAIFDTDLDAPFAAADLRDMVRKFYAGIGLSVDQVLPRSDLDAHPKKNPHAFCTDIDRKGDVRVLGNIEQNNYWASTLLHEFGHSVYSTNNNDIPQYLPYPLRQEAHILTTEGVAMMFERLSKRGAFLKEMKIKVKDVKAYDEAGARALRMQLLIFSRWCQVMLRFEKSMYENPSQDLNKLWWDLVEKYQLLKRPEGRNKPDYASKIHIVVAPVYYHNYMMGELFASQLHHTIARELYKAADPESVIYVDNREVGQFMKQRVFEKGRLLTWDGLTKEATGEPLNPKAFAEDFKKK